MAFANPRNQLIAPDSALTYAQIFPTLRLHEHNHACGHSATTISSWPPMCALFLLSNLIGWRGGKRRSKCHGSVPWPFTPLAAALFFPISYIFGDILTEVDGYGRDRRVVWPEFCCRRLRLAHGGSGRAPASFARPRSQIRLPWKRYSATRQTSVLGTDYRNSRCGTFVNSYVLAKMKIWTTGPDGCGRASSDRLVREIRRFRDLLILKPSTAAWSYRTCFPQLTGSTQYTLKSGWQLRGGTLDISRGRLPG